MTTESLRAWKDLCARLDELGSVVLSDDFATAEPLDMLKQLADQTANWLEWYVFHSDPARPYWHRQQDVIGQYGGPNADNCYRHVRLDPKLRYRVAGNMRGCEDWLMTLRTAFMFQSGTTKADYTASEMGFRPGEDFEFIIGPGGIEVPEGVIMATIREYYFDWQPREPLLMTIECLDAPDGAATLTDESLAERISTARQAIDHSMIYWNDYLENVRKATPANEFAPSHRGAKGLQLAQYLFCHWDLQPGESLVIDTDVPRARYWSFQLYPMGTFVHLDLHDRISSLNFSQVKRGDDGRVQVVVGDTDTGAANWLDTGGRQRGLLIFRWFWPEEGADEAPPSPSNKVVPAAELSGPVTPDERRATLAARRSHLSWRFRE
jgi:hypothetical protein